MAKRHHKGNVSRHHLYLGAGGILAAVALVTAVAFGFSKAQYSDPAAGCTSMGGTWTGSMCNMPGSGGGYDQQQQQNITCPNGTSHPSPYTCSGPDNCSSGQTFCSAESTCKPTGSTCGVQQTQNITCPNGSSHPSPYTCTAAENCPTGQTWDGTACTSGGAAAGGQTCTGGQIYCPAVGSSPAGCYTTCPTLQSTSQCSGGQIYCPAVGTSPAGCYTGTCPTIGGSSGPGNCTTGQYWNGTACVTSQTRQCGANEQPTAANPCMPSGMPAGGCTADQYWNGTACVTGQMRTCGANEYPTAQNPCVQSGTGTGAQNCTTGQYWNGTACTSGQMRACAAGEQPTSANPCMPSGTGTQQGQMRQCGPNEYPTAQNPCIGGGTGQYPGMGDQSGTGMEGQQGQFGQFRQCTALPAEASNCRFGFNFENGCPVGCREGEIQECAPGVMPSPQNPCRPTTFFFPPSMNQGRFPGEGQMMNGQMNGRFMTPFAPPAPCGPNERPSPQKPCIPNFDFSQGIPTFGDFDPSKQFEMFNQQFEFNPEEFQASRTPPAKMVAREAKMLKKELERMVKEINRATSRAANLTSCPGITEALSFSQAAQDRLNGVSVEITDENRESVWALVEATRGGPGTSPEESFFGQMGQIMPKVGMCEGATHMIKELSRCEKDLNRLAKDASGEALEAVQERLSSVAAWKANPFEGVDDFEDFDPSEFMERMDDLCGFGLQEIREAIHEERESASVCGGLEQSKQEIQGFLDGEDLPEGIPASRLADARKLAPKALAVIKKALASGDAEACIEASGELEEIGRAVFGDDEEEGGFQVDEKDVLKSQIADALEEGEDLDALIERISNQIVDKVVNKIELAANKIFSDMASKLASAGVSLNEASQAALSNIAGGLSKETLDAVLTNRSEISEVTAEAAPLIPEKLQPQFEAVVSETLQYNFSEEATAELKESFDSFSNFLASSPTEKEVKAELVDLRKEVEAFKVDPKEVDAQFEAGYIPFKDSGDPSQFHFDDLAALKAAGVVQGTGKSGGTQAEPGKQVNLAEASAMFVRALDLGEKFDAKPEAVKAQVPDWAKEELGVLAAAGVPEVLNASENFKAPATRGDFFLTQAHALAAAGVDLPEVVCKAGEGDFKDLRCDDAGKAALQLHEMGIVNGFPDGTIRLDGELNRAQAATLVNETLNNTAVKEALASEE